MIEKGKTYKNGLDTYQCLAVNGSTAIMENMTSHWRGTVHHILQYADGSIKWAYATAGRFLPSDK